MPVLWTNLPANLREIWAHLPAQEATTRLSDDLVVTARRSVYDRENGRYIFEDGVKAQLGLTQIQADRLTIDRKAGRARAEGKVILSDPEGIVRAEDLDIELNEEGRLKSATANRVGIDVAGIKLTAKKALISPTNWSFEDVSFTNCRQDPPFLRVRSPRVSISPGKRGRAVNPRFDVFGAQILKLPTQSFLLDPRVDGLRLPSFNYRKDEGFGVSWDSSILLNERSAISANAASFPSSFPAFGVQYSATNLGYEKSRAKIAPRSELRERFKYGYLETVEVKNPAEEHEDVAQARSTWSVGSQWNQKSVARATTETFSKPLELAAEFGGLIGAKPKPGFLPEETGVGWSTQVRFQAIQPSGETTMARALSLATVSLPALVLTPGVETLIRVETGFFGGKSTYGWGRSMLGLTVRPIKQITIGAAYVQSESFGTPEFIMDELLATTGYHIRADADLGPTKLSLLWKWDRARKWYDREYQFSQVMGCLEPFALYRQVPGDYRIGIRFRLEDFRALIQKRDIGRAQAPPPVRRTLFRSPN
ncbi:MAG: LptA/OstA family protein [Fimbriimonas sp.]